MYKKILLALLFAFIVIGASSAAEFKINEGFTPQTEYYSVNEENGMHLCTWDYEDELNQEFYLQNSTDYHIVAGDNNTYNITEDINGELADTISYLTSGNAGLNYGVLEIVEADGEKQIIYAYMESASPDDWKACYDELMKFNENNNLEPIADAI